MKVRAGWATLGLVLAATLGWAGDAVPPPAEDARRTVPRQVEAGNPAGAAEVLLGLEAGGVVLTAREDLLLGMLLLRLGRAEEAVPRLDRATTDSVLADYALLHLAAARRSLGDHAAAAEALQRLVDGHPVSLHGERAARELVRDWLDAGEPAKAEAAAGAYLGRFKNGPGVASVWVTLGEILVLTGRSTAAEQVFRRVWVELPAGPETERAKDWLALLQATPFTRDEQFLRAATLYRLGRHAQALTELAPFAAPGDPREARARLWLGISAFNLRQYEQAARWFLPLREVDGPDRAEALFWLGRSVGRAGDSAGFSETLTRLADSLPTSRRAEEALYLLAQSAADDGEAARGRPYLARLLAQYPKGAWRDVALWLEGWLAFKQQDLKAALAAWDRLLAEERTSRYRVPALYWRGRVLESSGRRGEAARAYAAALDAADEQPYYVMRAGQRLARLGKAAARPLVKTVAAVPAKGTPARPHAEKARALRDLGLVDDAVEEYREHATAEPTDRTGLGEACRVFLELERYERALWLGRRLLVPLLVQGGKLPISQFWDCLYPLAHRGIVADAAKRHGVDPLLVTALMREESAFVPRALSGAGARGLMQLMPQTAERIARELGLPGGAGALDWPEANIRLGTAHLAELVRLHRGNLALVLATYNAGKQPVQRWLERLGFADEEAFIEEIPYAETRNYVKRVLGTYYRYRQLYGAEESREPSE
jgi:soluble lytic murein transglycosylase